jgi:hypothetical protein
VSHALTTHRPRRMAALTPKFPMICEASGMTILPEQIAELERGFCQGLAPNWAADNACVTSTTAQRYYQEFTARGIPRGIYRRKPRVARPYKIPHYSGPAWIGVPAPGWAPPVPIGPDWVGKPIIR